MKAGNISFICLSACMACLLSVNGAMATSLEKPTPNLTEHWVTAFGWSSSFGQTDHANVLTGWTNETLMTQFQTRSMLGTPSSQFVSLCGLTNSSDGRFSGDYSKIDAVSFELQLQNAPDLFLYIKSSSGVIWRKRLSGLPLNTVPGQSVNATIALAYDETWWSDSGNHIDAAAFKSDKTNVVEIGVEARRIFNNNDKIQQVVVDNAKLIGPWNSFTADGVSLAWLMENNLTEGQALLDTDGDGILNVAEFLAGTDPNSSNSFFSIQIARNDQGKTVVKWKDNKYMTFDLLESSDLKAGFTSISGPAGILGSGAEQVVEVGNNVTGARFYKVQIRAAQ